MVNYLRHPKAEVQSDRSWRDRSRMRTPCLAMSRAREIESWEICTRVGGRDDAMDLQAIGTSKKCIVEPDKMERSGRTSAAGLVADLSIWVYWMPVQQAARIKNINCPHSRRCINIVKEEVSLLVLVPWFV